MENSQFGPKSLSLDMIWWSCIQVHLAKCTPCAETVPFRLIREWVGFSPHATFFFLSCDSFSSHAPD